MKVLRWDHDRCAPRPLPLCTIALVSSITSLVVVFATLATRSPNPGGARREVAA